MNSNIQNNNLSQSVYSQTEVLGRRGANVSISPIICNRRFQVFVKKEYTEYENAPNCVRPYLNRDGLIKILKLWIELHDFAINYQITVIFLIFVLYIMELEEKLIKKIYQMVSKFLMK